jgi:hypothetical protein
MNALVARRILRESAVVFGTNLLVRTAGIPASFPDPTDPRAIVVNGPSPYHILLIGSGVVPGNGVASHALGVGGHLARYVSSESGCGVQLDVVPIPSLLLRFAPAHLSRLDLGRYEAVILAAGVNDAFGITSRRKWRRGLSSTLQLLKSQLPPARNIFMVSIADPTPSPLFRPRPARRASVRARIFNVESSRQVEGDTDITMIGFEIGRATGRLRLYDSASYLGWARQMGPAIVQGLARIRPNR